MSQYFDYFIKPRKSTFKSLWVSAVQVSACEEPEHNFDTGVCNNSCDNNTSGQRGVPWKTCWWFLLHCITLVCFLLCWCHRLKSSSLKKIKNEVPPSVLANQIPVRDGVIKDPHPCWSCSFCCWSSKLRRTAEGRTSLLPRSRPPSGGPPGRSGQSAPCQTSGLGRKPWRLPEAHPGP